MSQKVVNVLSEPCSLQRGDPVLVILPQIPEWWQLSVVCIQTGELCNSYWSVDCLLPSMPEVNNSLNIYISYLTSLLEHLIIKGVTGVVS